MPATAEMTEAAKQLEQDYRMPMCGISEVVNWYTSGDFKQENPTPAIITKIGHRGLNLSVIGRDRSTFMCFSGVRHVSDPDLRIEEFAKFGMWDHTPMTKLLHRLSDLLPD